MRPLAHNACSTPRSVRWRDRRICFSHCLWLLVFEQPSRGVSPRRYEAQRSTDLSTNIYVGNLAFSTNNADLEALFAEHGEVTRAQVITDRDTGRSRGFGFVEMASADEANEAMRALNGRNVDGRDLKVNQAKERS